MTTVTQWFDGDEEPEHVGPYQRKYEFGGPGDVGVEFPDFWDGKIWFITNAHGDLVTESPARLPWRGLAEKPQP